jgi:hypothetical protein
MSVTSQTKAPKSTPDLDLQLDQGPSLSRRDTLAIQVTELIAYNQVYTSQELSFPHLHTRQFRLFALWSLQDPPLDTTSFFPT